MQDKHSEPEQDPNGLDNHQPGAKLDGNKPDMSLLLDMGDALKAVAHVGTIGAKKYTRGGWLLVDEGYRRYTAALLRHITDEPYGMLDHDTQCLHAAQVAWNALARLELILREMEKIKNGKAAGQAIEDDIAKYDPEREFCP